MARREPKPEDYESNEDFAYDMGLSFEAKKRYDCSHCAAGDHDTCQELAIIGCKCFLVDHEETF